YWQIGDRARAIGFDSSRLKNCLSAPDIAPDTIAPDTLAPRRAISGQLKPCVYELVASVVDRRDLAKRTIDQRPDARIGRLVTYGVRPDFGHVSHLRRLHQFVCGRAVHRFQKSDGADLQFFHLA